MFQNIRNGRPNDAPKMKYLDWLYKEDTKNKIFDSLDELLNEARKIIDELGINKNNEIIPIHLRKIIK